MENVSMEQRRWKFLLVAPLIVLPFLTVIFWVLGGGTQDPAGPGEIAGPGLKTDLPGAKLDEKPMNKMSYYDAAKKDSSLRAEMQKDDPFFSREGIGVEAPMSGPSYSTGNYSSLDHGGGSLSYGGYTDPHEARVQERLNALNRALEQPGGPEPEERATPIGQSGQEMGNKDVDRLESMMKMMQEGDGGEDPELQQLSGMLQNILDIQHPERVKEKLKQTSLERKGQVFSVSASSEKNPVSLLVTTVKPAEQNGFYSEETISTVEEANSIQAAIYETQTLVEGSVVKLRLLTDIYINGVLIPKDLFVFGTAGLEGERLTVRIDNIRYGSSLYPVKLTVYDLDGLSGIHVPGAITRDVAKTSSAGALQSLSLATLDPSIGAQAASAGIEFSKNLLGKKVKQVKVTVKAGYRVLLKDDNRKEE